MTADGYEEVRYQQFDPSPAMQAALRVAGAVAAPLVWGPAVLARRSDIVFRSCSEALALVPYLVGVVLRAAFYRRALRSCGVNLVVEFGAVLVYRDVSVGDNVLIGRYTIVHHCDIGDYALIGERCTFLSGSRQHRFDRTDIPMARQGGQRKRIVVGRDCWIGSHAVVMDDVGAGSVVAAAAVVTAPVEPGSIVAGNPARLLRHRTGAEPSYRDHREERAVSVEPAAGAWAAYWEGMEHRHIFVAEARDYVARLREAVPLRPTDRVLDFGCGFGHVVALLAPTVAHVGYWDAASGMREATAVRTAALPDVTPVDLAGPVPAGAASSYDLILANSVVQYMSRDELTGWLTPWRSLLAPGGQIVLSDIPPPDGSALGELIGMLWFAARHGFLVRALRDGFDEARRYSRSRGAAELQRWSPEDLRAAAAARDLTAAVLPRNLTHRAGRRTVVLTAA